MFAKSINASLIFFLFTTLLYSSNLATKFTKAAITPPHKEHRRVPQNAIDNYYGMHDQSTTGETIIFMEDFES